ncbi:MAG TPA: OmpA family protein [Saprospiraceae bacterium]|nr:OmpA family protein [Saprospiraceae bacterium]MCB9270786.1 OmpA family protein [Lewinellaceae bacterium]HPG05844.1 OmpA family protein [Saprospiraceae bacterium]HQU53494.1 OmpA family protein [Saprospiraceae bacterium]HRV85809.1 OmpA family protein [Saprospiraceae bacterium]
MKKITTLILLASILGLGTSCVSKKKFDALTQDKMNLEQSLEASKMQVSKLEDEKSTLTSEKNDLSTQVSSLKQDLSKTQQEVAQVKTQVQEQATKLDKLESTITSAFAPIEKTGWSVHQENDMLYISVENPVLFRSGSASVNRDAKEIINGIADVLKNNPDVKMIVEGHADNKTISTDRFPSNWELSAARSASVVKALVKAGVEPARLTVAGRSDTMPASAEGNSTADARKMNRRTEFILVPGIAKLYELEKM